MEIKNKKFTIISLGCRVNNVESAYIANKIQEEGGIYTDLINETKIAIINTCCVTQKAIKKSLLFIRRLNKQKNIELIIITGCFVQLNNCKIKYKKVGIIAGNNQKTKICSLIKKYNDKRIINVSKLTSRTKFENFNTNNFVHNTRAHIKIQDGCNNLCTYCIIPHVRGRQRSLKHEKIISHIKKLIKKKYKEIVLTGVNTSGYDDGKYNFYKLLKKIDTLKGNFRVRISSLEPFQINTTIIDLLTKNKKRWCQSFHLCLQNANNDVLKKMNRKYTFESFWKICNYIINKSKYASITTDYIVGFPTETKEQFNNSLLNLKKLHLSNMHIFPYSHHKNTPAFYYKNIVNSDIDRRINIITDLNNNFKKKYLQKFINKKINILFEKSHENNMQIGQSNYFFKVKVNANKKMQNQIKKIQIVKIYNYQLYGKVLN